MRNNQGQHQVSKEKNREEEVGKFGGRKKTNSEEFLGRSIEREACSKDVETDGDA